MHVVVDAEPDPEIAQLKSELRAVDINVLRAYETAYSLEDVFISIVEKQQAANKKK